MYLLIVCNLWLTSLNNLTKNLPEEAFIYTKQVFKDDKLALMQKKGIYPYDYMSSFEKFTETQLPSKGKFFSLLTQEMITNEQYQHATHVWEKFNL